MSCQGIEGRYLVRLPAADFDPTSSNPELFRLVAVEMGIFYPNTEEVNSLYLAPLHSHPIMYIYQTEVRLSLFVYCCPSRLDTQLSFIIAISIRDMNLVSCNMHYVLPFRVCARYVKNRLYIYRLCLMYIPCSSLQEYLILIAQLESQQRRGQLTLQRLFYYLQPSLIALTHTHRLLIAIQTQPSGLGTGSGISNRPLRGLIQIVSD